jgi:integrase/recombinase XerD
MNQKLSIRFVISPAKINKRGLCPILCRLTYRKKRKTFSTGLFVQPKNWNSKKQEVSSKSFQVDYLNSALQKIFLQISKSYLLLQMESYEIEVEDIYNGYLGKPVKQKEYVVAYFKNYLGKIEKLIGKEIVFATRKKYNYTCNQVEQFIQWKYNKKDYAFEDLKLKFLTDFDYFLKTELNQVQITVNKAIQRLRKPIKVAVAEGYIVKDPFTAQARNGQKSRYFPFYSRAKTIRKPCF